ncbi:MAG: helicase-related protein [Desulfitobacteriia bacterium]|jgi:hypothetical protein
MELRVINNQRQFSTFLHFVVIDKTDSLICASIGGIESSVTAVTAAIIEHRQCQLDLDNNRFYQIRSDGEYKRLIKMSGQTAHGLVIHKAAVYEENCPSPIIFAEDGNIEQAVGYFLSKRFALPKEWIGEYYSFLPKDEVEELEVHTNPLVGKYANLRAVRLSDRITEETILNEIDTKLKNGRLTIPKILGTPNGKFNPSWTTKEYLTENAIALAGQLDVMQPRFDPKNSYHKLDKNLGLMNRLPLPVQAMVIQGTVNAMTAKKNPETSIFCGGDMGTGKSISALGVTHLLHQKAIQNGRKGYKVLLVAPGLTIPKWINAEIKKTLPWAKIRVISNQNNALKLLKQSKDGYEPDGLEFVIVGTDRAKLGPEPWCSAIWKRVKGEKFYAWHCPNCGEALLDPDPDTDESGDCLAGWNVLAYGSPPDGADLTGEKNTNGVPVNHPLKWKNHSRLKKCSHCENDIKTKGKSKLWRPGLKSRDEARNRPRWFISRIIKKMGPWFDLMIQDEVHQCKAQDSGRGDAFGQMIKAAKKVLMLTGTLVNGKSTSIKEIIWRTDPKALLDNGFDHRTGMVQWAGRYGVLKKVTTVSETDTGVTVRKKKTELQPTEEPGISPSMTTEFLLHKTAFMELGDLGLPLIEKKEIPVFLDMDKEHAQEYKSFHETLHEKCKKIAQLGGKGAWSKFLPAVLNYADRPDLGSVVEFKNGDVIAAPEFDKSYYTSKERWLIETVKKELAENRGVVIYNKYTDGYGVNERIQMVLKNHGIDSDILSSNTSPEKRVEWLAEKANAGRKVLICNMRLVEVGLDLLPWPTLIFYQLDYDINIVRQSGARSWRIGQHRECRIYYPILNETQQVAQFQNLMTKRAHALIVEGRLDRPELAQFGRDAHNSMASDLAGCLADANLANQWQELAARDLDKDLKVVSEADFKHEVAEAMKKLQSETMSLCGVTETERESFLQSMQKVPVANTEPKLVKTVAENNLIQIDLFSIESEDDRSSDDVDFTIPLKVVESKQSGYRGKYAPVIGQIGFAW